MVGRSFCLIGVAAVALAGCQSQADVQLRSPAEVAAARAVEVVAEPTPPSRAHFGSRRSRGVLGDVKVVGGQVDDASQVAASMLPSFANCKMRWSPESLGAVQVSAKIGPVGEVRIATPEEGQMPPMVVACIRSKVAGAKFAPPTGADPTVVIPIRFVAD